MKNLIAFSVLAFSISSVSAVDVITKMVVKVDGIARLESSTNIYGLTDAQAADLKATGMKNLDYASKQQDKGGNYSIEWTWNNEPTIITGGMRWSAVNSVLRKGTKWLDNHVLKVEKVK